MPWTRIKNKSQIEAIHKGSLLLKYQQTIIIPEELTNDNIGDVYTVKDISSIADGVRISIVHSKENSIQKMLENTFPSVLDSEALLRDGWFVQTI